MSETKIPAIPEPPQGALYGFLSAVKNAVEVRLGLRGDKLDRAVTLRELFSSGVITGISGGISAPVSSGSAWGYTLAVPPVDLTPPPAPTSLTTGATWSQIFLEWDWGTYSNHDVTEIWRRQVGTDPAVNYGTCSFDGEAYSDGCQMVASPSGKVWQDNVGDIVNATGDGQEYYYWVRLKSSAGVTGDPYPSAAAGILGTLTKDPAHALSLLNDALTANEIKLGAIGSSELAIDAVTANKIAANAVTVSKILNGAINSDKIASNAVTVSKILNGAIDSDKIAANAVLTTNLAANAVTTTKITDNAITTPKIVANAITATQINADAVTANKIAAGSVSAIKIATDAITAGKIATNAITANKILAGAVTTNKILAGAIDASKITAGAITSDKILAGAVTANKLLATDIYSVTMQSTNYSAGTSGWNIDKGGNAEFNSGTFRGTLNVKSATSGARMEMTNSTLRVYDSAGTLRVKIGDLS